MKTNWSMLSVIVTIVVVCGGGLWKLSGQMAQQTTLLEINSIAVRALSADLKRHLDDHVQDAKDMAALNADLAVLKAKAGVP